jgi:S-DNA-T family DNA segregation ATPase FtsK/SpoIIIE
LVVAAPPLPPPSAPTGPAGWLLQVLPFVGAAGSFAVVLAGPPPLVAAAALAVAGALLLAGIGLIVRQRSTGRGQRLGERVRYLDHLDNIRRTARRTAELQAADGRWHHPHAAALWQLADDPTRLWERRPGEPDFLAVRVGLGRVPLARPVVRDVPERGAGTEVDPVSEDAARRLVESSRTVDGQPLVINLTKAPSVAVAGPPDQAWSLARAIVAQVVAWHAPSEVRVALALSSESAALWTWVKWLPHVEHPRARDAEGPARLFSTDAEELTALLGAELRVREHRRSNVAGSEGGHLVIVVDRGVDGPLLGAPELDAALSDPGPLGVSVVHVVTDPGQLPSRVDVRLRLERDTVVVDDAGQDAGQEAGHTVRRAAADQLSLVEAEVLGRRLAALRLGDGVDDGAGTVAPADVLGFDPEQLDISLTWKARPAADLLRAPIGAGPDGRPVYVDLKDSAVGGMGPHAVCVGAPGSGKSELLQTVVVALAATHSPDHLALLLVDFSGRGTFTDLTELPQVAGAITDLAGDLALVDRLRDALIGEMQRRQELMRAAGRASVRDYEAARTIDTALAPLPHLVVVIDEFTEMVTARPAFNDILVALGRLGSSLGIHLLLAARRFEADRLHSLGSYLSCRIGLRTVDPHDSQAVLGVPDMHELPPVPGAGYLKSGDAAPHRFRAAHVSGPPRLASPPPDITGLAGAGVLPFTASALQLPDEPAPAFAAEDDDMPSTVRLIVDQVRDQAQDHVREQGERAHRVWLPPFDEPPTLDQLLSAPVPDADRGLILPDWPDQGRLRIPIGMVDRPVQQQQDVLAVDLIGGGGNVAIVGGPRSGKTGLLRTLVAAAALTHTPAELRFYGADLGGGGLARLRDFPHVAAVASRLEPEHVRQLVAEVASLLTERVDRFGTSGIGAPAAMRELRAAGRLPEEPFGDVVLLIDGWTALRREFADLESVVSGVAARGPAHAVHVVLAANRWAHLRPPIKNSFGTRLELRLSDPAESATDREEAANVPVDRPGRGLTQEKLHFQVALPRVDGIQSADGLGDALSGLARASREAFPGH